MSCFFCGSNYHASQYCNIYTSDDIRQRILFAKNCCPNCLGLLSSRYHCEKCKNNDRKCFICFSNVHSTIYCPNRFKVLKIFLPKIDEDLLSRFVQFFNIEEKWTLASLHPNLFNHAFKTPIKVGCAEICYYSNLQKYLGYDLIVLDICNIPKDANFLETVDIPSSINPPIFFIKTLEICCKEIFSHEFLMLLSTKTVNFKCGLTNFQPELNFREILEKAPYLEDIEIDQTNVKVNNSWPNDILHLKNDSLRLLNIAIPDINFDTESLIALFKKKSVKIYLFISVTEYADIPNGINEVRQKLPECFISRLQWENDARIFFVFGHPSLCSNYYNSYAFSHALAMI